MKIGLCGKFFDSFRAKGLCILAEQFGFEAVSLSCAQIKELDTADFKSDFLQEICWSPGENISMVDAAKSAEELGVKVLVIPVMCASSYAEDISSVIADTNLLIAFENDEAASFTTEDVISLIDSWNKTTHSKRFYACLNTGHALLHGEKSEKLAQKLGNCLISVHANDNHGNRDYHLLPYRGRGGMDWNGILMTLADIQYKGVFYLDIYSALTNQSPELAKGWVASQACLARYMGETAAAYRDPEKRSLKIKEWLLEELRSGTMGITADVAFLSLVERLTEEGFLPESVTGHYTGELTKTAGDYALLMLENGKEKAAGQVLSYVLETVRELGLSGIPRVIGEGRKGMEPYTDTAGQVDGSAHIVLAYAKLCLQASDAEFEEKYYAVCRREMMRCCASLKVTISEKDATSFNLCTHAFVGAAGEAMKMLAKRRGDIELAMYLEEFIPLHREYTSVNPLDTHSCSVYGPLAAGWDGVDAQVAEDAMNWLEKHTEICDESTDTRINMCECKANGSVEQKNYYGVVGCMIEHARLRKDYEKIRQWALFLRNTHSGDYNLAEMFYRKDGRWIFRDRGNAAQGVWFCMMVYRLRRELEEEFE